MVNVFWVASIVSVLFSLTALIVGCVALAFVVGLKNSTHQVVWKPLDPVGEDPFAPSESEEEEVFHPSINPNKRHASLPKEEEAFADLDDPSETSNNW